MWRESVEEKALPVSAGKELGFGKNPDGPSYVTLLDAQWVLAHVNKKALTHSQACLGVSCLSG